MVNVFAKRCEGFANESQTKQLNHLEKTSNASSGRSSIIIKFEKKPGIEQEALLKSSTRELVEFYWSNRKRFSGGYVGFPVEVS